MLGAMLLGQTGVAFATNILLARWLGPSQFGVYSFWVSLVTFLAIPVVLGLPNLVNRELVFFSERNEYGRAKGLLVWSAWVVAVSSIFACLVIYVLGTNLARETPYWQGWLPILALVLLPTMGANNLRAKAMAGLHKVVAGSIPERLVRPSALLFGLGIVYWSQAGRVDVQLAMGAQVVATLLTFGIGTLLLRRSLGGEIKGAEAIVDGKVWFFAALPLTLVSSIQMLNKQVDVVFLGILSTPEDVGVYQVAARIALLAGFLHLAYTTVIAGQIAKLWERRDLVTMQEMVGRGTAAVTVLTGAGVVAFMFVGADLLELTFGSDYVTAFMPTMILLVGQMINVAFGPVGLLLNMTAYATVSARVMAVTAVVNVVLNVVLIPTYGMYGAAFSTTASYIVFNVWLYVMCRRLLDIDSSPIGAFSVRGQKI